MSDIKTGDLVLRNGCAEEVSLYDHRTNTYTRSEDGRIFPARNATRIGAVSDGWRIHTGGERPEGVGAEDRVEVVCVDGTKHISDLPHMLHWGQGRRFVHTVAAYCIVQRGERPANPTSDLRAVAAEMRTYATKAHPQTELGMRLGQQMFAWAERISPADSPANWEDKMQSSLDMTQTQSLGGATDACQGSRDSEAANTDARPGAPDAASHQQAAAYRYTMLKVAAQLRRLSTADHDTMWDTIRSCAATLDPPNAREEAVARRMCRQLAFTQHAPSDVLGAVDKHWRDWVPQARQVIADLDNLK